MTIVHFLVLRIDRYSRKSILSWVAASSSCPLLGFRTFSAMPRLPANLLGQLKCGGVDLVAYLERCSAIRGLKPLRISPRASIRWVRVLGG